MENIDKIVAVLYSLLILVNGLFLRKLHKTWLSPACLFSLFWFFYTFFPLTFLPSIPINPNAVAFITLLVLSFNSTSVFFDWKKLMLFNSRIKIDTSIFKTKLLKIVLVGSVLLSLISSILQVLKQGFSISDLLTDILTVAGDFAGARYKEELTYTVFGPISLLFSNIAVIIGGLVFGSSENVKKKYFTVFVPSLVIMLTQSSKGLFFLSVFLFLGGILVCKLFRGELKLFTFDMVLRVIILIVIFITLLSVSFMSRGLQNIDDTAILITQLKTQFFSYAFTHLYAFSDWFTAYTSGGASRSYDTSNYYCGFYTFTVFFRMMGSTKVTGMGVFDEFFTYQDLQSNIYTIFRGMVMDFGLLGSFLFMMLNGLFFNVSFFVFLKSKKPLFTTLLLIFMVGYFYISFGVSLLTWTIIPFTFIICYIILKLNAQNLVGKKVF